MRYHPLFVDSVHLGKKGQITIPKKIRDEDNLREDDCFRVVHMPGGDILLTRRDLKKPEDRMLEIIKSMPPLDWKKAWGEIEEERKKEHR